MYVFNVSEIINETSSFSTYIVDSIDIWRGKLGHINKKYIKKLKQVGLICNLNNDELEKWKISIESKFTKKTHKTVEKKWTLRINLKWLIIS